MQQLREQEEEGEGEEEEAEAEEEQMNYDFNDLTEENRQKLYELLKLESQNPG